MYDEFLSLPVIVGAALVLGCYLSRHGDRLLFSLISPASLMPMAIFALGGDHFLTNILARIVATTTLAGWVAYSIRSYRQPPELSPESLGLTPSSES